MGASECSESMLNKAVMISLNHYGDSTIQSVVDRLCDGYGFKPAEVSFQLARLLRFREIELIDRHLRTKHTQPTREKSCSPDFSGVEGVMDCKSCEGSPNSSNSEV